MKRYTLIGIIAGFFCAFVSADECVKCHTEITPESPGFFGRLFGK